MHYATRSIMNLTVIAIVIIAVANNCDAQQHSDELTPDERTKTHIKKLLVLQVGAWNEGDIDKFMETYWKSPQLTFSSGGQTTRGWQATLDRYKKRYHTRDLMGNLRFDQIEVLLLSSDVALVLGQWHLTRKDDTPHGNFSLVVRKINDNWQIIHDHSSTLEELETKPDDTKEEQSD